VEQNVKTTLHKKFNRDIFGCNGRGGDFMKIWNKRKLRRFEVNIYLSAIVG
jgi:hypothetical protein